MTTTKVSGHGSASASWLIAATACTLLLGAARDEQPPSSANAAPSLDEARLVMGKWIETQRIIAKERNDWQQSREVLVSRIELVKKEVESLELKLTEAQDSVTKITTDREAIDTENQELKRGIEHLATAVSSMEDDIRALNATLPQPAKEKIEPLYQRIPEEHSEARVAVAERYQNVLGIFNELNKFNNEITVSYEVHNLADNKPSEVKAIYVGLAQAYFVSAKGEAGIGRPSSEGWVWVPSKEISNDVLKTLEILQGTHTPAFVPLPVKIQ